ncbi:hypothetical protein FZW96_18440 [Bacillus sp. BGMRC 2118]|nr:hypothetical protein FZW96_18440 [Bacillus sp. BGMRC 2118]
MMKNIGIVLGTIVVKSALLWYISQLLDWKFIDFAFLGGVALFGLCWFFQMNAVKMRNENSSYSRGMYRNDDQGVEVFRFQLNPVLTGMILYILLSGISTFVYYIEYF